MKKSNEETVSLDHFFNNRVKIFQNRNGYRFSIDSPILADFIPPSDGKILEVGAGSGIISFLLLFTGKISRVKAVEIQKSLFSLAGKSAEINGFSDNIELFCGNFNKIYEQFRGVDVIFSNPPYLKTNTGRLSENEEIKAAKFETMLKLDELLEKSSEILNPEGNIYLIFPFSRYDELMEISNNIKLNPVTVRKVFSFSYGNPERFLIQLSRCRKSFKELSPLVIYDSPGKYSKEMGSVLAGIRYDK